MEINIVSADKIDLSFDLLLSELHMDELDRESARVKNVLAIHEEALEIAKPIALYTVSTPEFSTNVISLNGVEISEPFVCTMLSGNEMVIPYVASCGLEIEEWSQQLAKLLDQFIADKIKEMCLTYISNKLVSELQDKYFEADKNICTLNPGSLNEWPMEGQKQLFSVLGGVTDDIGVALTSSMLMTPIKSVSGIFFQSDEPFDNCQLCLRVDCPKRKAPYGE